jgi:hypothetical protein
VLVLATWEGAYRATAFDPITNPSGYRLGFRGGLGITIPPWRPWVFPAPSDIADALLDLLNIRTDFGAPLHKGWPFPKEAPHERSVAQPAGGPAALPMTARSAKPSFLLRIIHSPLVEAELVSGVRLLIGFASSIVLGATLGILMWRFGPLDEFLGPLFLGMQTLPSVCWVPLGIIGFGLSEQAIEFVLIMGSFFAIAISLRDGLRTIPPLYQRAGLMLGAGGWRLYWYVLLPASLPALAGGLLRLAIVDGRGVRLHHRPPRPGISASGRP